MNYPIESPSYGGRHPTYPEVGALFGSWSFQAPGAGYNWQMLCRCGTARSVRSQDLRMGRSTSCGCRTPQGRTSGLKNKAHGQDYGSKLYRTWRNAKNRCFNPKATKYLRYGAAGITMYPAWANDFPAFAQYVGEPPSPLHTLDREDNTKGYEPGNVRWATAKEQCNNRQLTIKLCAFGQLKPLSVWAEEYSINYCTLKQRVQAGWDVERALTQPVKGASK